MVTVGVVGVDSCRKWSRRIAERRRRRHIPNASVVTLRFLAAGRCLRWKCGRRDGGSREDALHRR